MERPDGTAGIPECMRSFEAYLAANLRTEKPVIHLSLNPHPDDRLSDGQLEAIGREYMEKLGYGDQPTSFSGTRTTRAPISTSSPCA